MTDDPNPITEELRIAQVEKERSETEQAEQSTDPSDTQTHERRAVRAAYLREKLEQQQAADVDRRDNDS